MSMVEAIAGTAIGQTAARAAGSPAAIESTGDREVCAEDARNARRRAEEAHDRARQAAQRAAKSFERSARLHDRLANEETLSQLIHKQFKFGASTALACSGHERNHIDFRARDRPTGHR
jgi:hypothetical protein